VGASRSDDWLIVWRDVARSTDERTLVASVTPRIAVGDKLPLLFSHVGPVRLSTLSSLVVDYAARGSASSGMSLFVVKQLPLGIDPVQLLPWGDALNDFAAPRVVEFTYTALDLQGWADDIGYSGRPVQWDDTRRELLRAEFDVALFQV
jgi:hypothetical protein